jgi:hypothetical protein
MKSKSYRELAADIIAKDGWGGLFGRGLQVGVMMMMFTWNIIVEKGFI